ncbi:MAG: hypothetical protein DRP49_07350 [Spirochaetes bacterium]|nr:MAG: hypothetical protein DRP49_07350 [Spirochaetota bacterium]
MSEKYGRQFEAMMQTARMQAIALFPPEQEPFYDSLPRLSPTGNSPANILGIINHTFFQRGYNPLYFSRRNILRVRENKLGRSHPLNKGAIWSSLENIDSS